MDSAFSLFQSVRGQRIGIAEFPPVFPKQPKTDLGSSLACLSTEVALPKVQQSADKSLPQLESQQNSVFLLGNQSTENLEGFMMQIKGRKKKEDTLILYIKSSH